MGAAETPPPASKPGARPEVGRSERAATPVAPPPPAASPSPQPPPPAPPWTQSGPPPWHPAHPLSRGLPDPRDTRAAGPAAAPPSPSSAREPAAERPSAIGAWFNRLVRGDRPPPAETGPASASAQEDASGAAATVATEPAAAGSPVPDATSPASDASGPAGQAPAPPLSAQARAALAALEQVDAGELARLADPGSGTVLARAAQAEVDRRAARDARRQQQQQQQSRSQQVAALQQQEREARQSDVYRAAELRDQLDAYQQQEQFVHGLVRVYDSATLDPLLEALPEADRPAVLQAVTPEMDALEGRRSVLTTALQRLEAQWRADERQKLRANRTFRQQVLAEARAGRNGTGPAGPAGFATGGDPAGLPDPSDELGPELLAGGHAVGAPPPDMNTWLRGQIRQR
jgi:hypothetical protein